MNYTFSKYIFGLLIAGLLSVLCTIASDLSAQTAPAKTEHATFAMGCFWHSEEMFLETKGVIDAIPGYSGGTEKDPSYELVGSGDTRYAESVDITYDPSVISYGKLLQIFFSEHDPTTPNMQYPDMGPQYRSVIFYRNADQKSQAQKYITQLTSAKTFLKPIVTEVSPFEKFYRAEEYHLRYVRNHPNQSYVSHVTKAEIDKFRRDFPDWVK